MPDTGFIAVFLIGLLGGTHCAAMCGGIVSALSIHLPGDRPQWPLHIAYNLGRITTYSALGALLGAVSGVGLLLNDLLPVQLALYVAANLMLVALGLYLTGVSQALAVTERWGQAVWRRLEPLGRRYLPARTPGRAFLLGTVWGMLPCGMVYSVLSAALLTGSAPRGAALMLAFGLGTLPNLLLAGLLLKRLKDFTRRRAVRVISGSVVLAFGIFGLVNATTLGGRLWEGVVCRV